jgi:glycosyltransferase involved in cell wall biosynthesis
MSRLGWFLESQVSPRVYRGHRYVTVSGRSRDELVDLGVDAEAITVVHNGTDRPMAVGVPRSSHPTIVVLGRLVPHKRVELAIEAVARLRHRHPGLRMRVVGDGWWHDRVAAHAAGRGVSDIVDLLGYVDEVTKHRELSSAWIQLAPSAKEGWGLNVVEAASHGVPTIAHHGAGGLSESVVDGVTGLLVDDLDGMVEAASLLLHDAERRESLGEAARVHAQRHTWDAAVDSWEQLLAGIACDTGSAAPAPEAASA